MATQKARPPVIDQLRIEAGSNDPYVSGRARQALSALGKKGSEVRARRRRAAKERDERQLALDVEAYRRASRGE